jgi:hypothetical protein
MGHTIGQLLWLARFGQLLAGFGQRDSLVSPLERLLEDIFFSCGCYNLVWRCSNNCGWGGAKRNHLHA